MTKITLVHRLAETDGERADRFLALLTRTVAALEQLFTLDAPGLAPAGALLIVPRGAPVEISVNQELPLGKDGLLRFRPDDYDGPIALQSVEGGGSFTSEDAAGDLWRVSHDDDAVEGETITAVFEADRRHGAGVLPSDDTVTVTLIARDAEPLTEGEFDVVEKGEPAPAPAA